MEGLKKLRNYSFAISIVYIILGLLMILNPGFISNAINYVIGFLIILYGVVYIINLLTKKEEYILNRFNFFSGVMCISFGLFLVLNPEILQKLIPFCGSIIIFVDAIYQIRNSIVLKKNGYKYWYINLIVAGVFILFSVFVMIKAKEITKTLIGVLGGVLLFDAILDIYTTIMLNKTVKKIVSADRILEADTKEE
jgi:uncharacterized membrane protein HdeD (DUF308 family)